LFSYIQIDMTDIYVHISISLPLICDNTNSKCFIHITLQNIFLQVLAV